MFSRTRQQRRSRISSPSRFALAVVLGVAMSAAAAAQAAGNGVKLTPAQKQQAQQMVDLMKAALGTPIVNGKKGCLDLKLKTLLNQGGNGGSVDYEKTEIKKEGGAVEEVDTTLGQALENLKKLIADDRVRLSKLSGGTAAATRLAAGTSGDLILVNDFLWNLCFGGGGGGGYNACAWKTMLMNAFINELAHVYQKVNGTWGAHCDAERDSDVLSKKLLCRFLDAIEGSPGVPHTSVAAVNADAQAVPGFGALLASCGGGSAAEIAKVHKLLKAQKSEVSQRITDTFGAALAGVPNADNWGKKYYGVRPGRAIRYASDDALRSKTTLEDDDGTLHDFFPNVGQIMQSMAYLDDGDALVLVSATHDATGRRLHFWRDTDGDLVPEALPAAPALLLPGVGTPDPGLDGCALVLGMPAVFGGTGREGLLVHDHATGEVYGVELGADGLPTATAPVQILSDPVLGASVGFVFLDDVYETAPGQLRFVYSLMAPSMQHGGAPAVVLEGQGASPLGWSVAAPAPVLAADYLGTARPFAAPGVAEPAEIDAGVARLFGVAGENLQIRRLDAANQVLGGGLCDATGAATVFLLPPPAGDGALYRIEGAFDHADHFVPPRGRSVDSAEGSDENGDGFADRIDLTLDPPRLHLSLGVPGTATELRQHVYELALEDGAGESIQVWNGGLRRTVDLLGAVRDFQLLPGSNPPLYAQSLHDLDGDGGQDEAVVIRRAHGQPDFFLEIVDQVPFAPFPALQMPLPPAFVPDVYSIADADLDLDLDICVRGVGADPLLILNDGAGGFAIQAGVPYPGTGEDFVQIVSIDGGAPICSGVLAAPENSLLTIELDCPGGTFDYRPVICVGQLFTPGAPPAGVPSFGVVFDPLSAFLLVDGTLPSPLGTYDAVLPGGSNYQFLVPPGLGGQSLMLQSLVIDPGAQNGFFAASSGVELRFD